MKKPFFVIITIFILATIYGISRYIIFGNYQLYDIPVFIFNKSFAILSVFSILLQSISKNKLSKKIYQDSFFISVSAHILLSISILSPYYFSKFYLDNGSFSLIGGLVILLGVLSASTYFFGLFKNILSNKNLVILFYSFISLHLFFMGIVSWFNYSKWNAYLPPISLICFVVIFLSLFKIFKNEN